MTGTDLEIIPPAHAVIAGSEAERLPEIHTNARTDGDLLAVWLKSHADGSPPTRRAYERIGRRFLEALEATGASLKRATDSRGNCQIDSEWRGYSRSGSNSTV